MNITTSTQTPSIFDNENEIITNRFQNKTALVIYLVREAELASQFETAIEITVQIDDHKPAVYSAPATVSLDEMLDRVETFVENL